MSRTQRSTLVVPDRLAMREQRLAAARKHRHGLQILTFEQMASRLAGGFTASVDDETLRNAIQNVLPGTPLGELDGIKALPGMIDAAAGTLRKTWRAGLDLATLRRNSPRIDAIARLEAAVVAALPHGVLRPADMVGAASARIAHARAVLGSIELIGLADLAPCWRPLLSALAKHVSVCWIAGPRPVPIWLEHAGVEVTRSEPQSPEVEVVSAATPYHEAVEAMRWVRALLAQGVPAQEIAIACTSTAPYDGFLLALRAEADFDLCFAHGVPVLGTREGQAAAALADIVVRGLTQARLRRLVALSSQAPAFAKLPKGWGWVLPSDAPLATPDAWQRAMARVKAADWPDAVDHARVVLEAITLLAKGPDAAPAMGEACLTGQALAIWRNALSTGPAPSVDATLQTLNQNDAFEARVSVAWMPAAMLAGSPRPFVRLLGLNASRWPRRAAEDRLIPDHVLPMDQLDPRPIHHADREAFNTILATTRDQVALSCARRDGDGRRLGRSPLLATFPEPTYLPRNAAPDHALSEGDRLMGRPREFATMPQAVSALSCWKDWYATHVTPHDGLVQANHPLVQAILARTQSASSLKLLLRNPIGFVWKYAFGWQPLEAPVEPLELDALAFGSLVHALLERSLRMLESAGNWSPADTSAIEAAVRKASKAIAAEWEAEYPVPPAVIWEHTLEQACGMAIAALSYTGSELGKAHHYAEVPFGDAAAPSDPGLPWDPSAAVAIPGTGFAIKGYIDRLDIALDGAHAEVCDYKTGNPLRADVRLEGGKELQRCLYSFAVKAMLGEHVAVRASLLYPHDTVTRLPLDDPKGVLADLTRYLKAAKTNLASGAALPGVDAADDFDDLAFALPANANATYRKRKQAAVATRMGKAADVWEAP